MFILLIEMTVIFGSQSGWRTANGVRITVLRHLHFSFWNSFEQKYFIGHFFPFEPFNPYKYWIYFVMWQVGEQDRMKFTLYLVLDSHNIIKEKIIQHATANRKHLEDKQRRIVVPNWVSIFLALFFCVNNLCSFVVVWPIIVCLLHKHNYGSYPISIIFWQTYICRTLPNILLFNIM